LIKDLGEHKSCKTKNRASLESHEHTIRVLDQQQKQLTSLQQWGKILRPAHAS